MNEGQTPALVAQVREIILATFDVSEAVAQEHACGLALLAEGWGDPRNAHQQNWGDTVRKRMGETFPWRSDTERKAFYSDRDATVRSYERYIQQNKRA